MQRAPATGVAAVLAVSAVCQRLGRQRLPLVAVTAASATTADPIATTADVATGVAAVAASDAASRHSLGNNAFCHGSYIGRQSIADHARGTLARYVDHNL